MPGKKPHRLEPLPDAPFIKDKHIQAAGGPSAKLLEKMRQTGEGPPYVKLKRAVFYPRDKYLKWMEDRMVTSTREAAHV